MVSGRVVAENEPELDPFIRADQRAQGTQPVGHVAGIIEQRVADVPELTFCLLVYHLEVRQRRLAAWAPVDDPFSPVDEAVLVQVHESDSHRSLRHLVHREDLALPIA